MSVSKSVSCFCRIKILLPIAAAESVTDNSPIIANAERARAKEIYAAMLAVETKQADVAIGKF